MNKTFIQKIKKFIISKKFIVSLFVLLILFSLVGPYFYMKNFLNSKGQNSQTVEFTIQKGEGVREIAKDLEAKDLIKHDILWVIYLKLTGQSGELQAGEYTIKINSTPLEIIDILTKGKVASRKITIPEGWTNEQIGNYLENNGIVSKSDFLKAAQKNYNYWFLKDRPENATLEGFLFPDTYQLSLHVTADQIVEKMLNNFDKKINSDLKTQIETSSLNAFQIITLASMVEGEVAKPEDRKVVAGIFEKRLQNDMPLESCATIKYFLRSDKNIFSSAETHIPSPYNTYLNKGLPIGPISNPGLVSIMAVLNPTKTDYFYFLSAKRVTHYAKTLDQHEANKAKYLP